MDSYLAYQLLLWVHVTSLVVAGADAIGLFLAIRRFEAVAGDARHELLLFSRRLGTLGTIAIVLLLVSGPSMLWVKYGWQVPSHWFWVKIVLIVIMMGGFGMAQANLRRAGEGRAEKLAPARVGIAITLVSLVFVVLAAILAFR